MSANIVENFQKILENSPIDQLFILYKRCLQEMDPAKMQAIIVECSKRGINFWNEYVKRNQ